jgi:hypothetical protein
MRVEFLRSFVDAGVRVFHLGDSAEIPDQRAIALIHHRVVSPLIDPPLARIETTSASRRRKREIR